MMRQKQDHIHQNPVRRGYVDRPGVLEVSKRQELY
jgi:hypothetical protein